MANKLFLVCATLALFFLLANASIYRTVVEFDEESDDSTNPTGPMQKCQKEFQQEQHLRACQKFMRRQLRRGRGGGPSLDDDELDFEEEDDIDNPRNSDDIDNPLRPSSLLRRCCSELRQEDTVCVCPTLRQAARAVKLQGQHGPIQTRKIYKTAKHLPNICKIPQVGVCPFQAVPYIPSFY